MAPIPAMDTTFIPQLVLQALAALGSLFIFSKIFSFVRLLASLFILPGTSVSFRLNVPA